MNQPNYLPIQPSKHGHILIVCCVTGDKLTWNEAAQNGWVYDMNGPAFRAYYSPEGLRQAKLPRDAAGIPYNDPRAAI